MNSMNGKKQSQTNRPSSGRSTTNQSTDFNFDEWALEVRQQMMEALKRRGSV